MFGLTKLFSSKPFETVALGSLKKRNGLWRGFIDLAESKNIPISIFGNCSEPNLFALESTVQVLNSWDKISHEIQNSLYEHYLRGPTWSDSYPKIERTRLIDFIALEQIVVEKRKGRVVIEIAIRTAWDEEHTLGARLVNRKLEELCESI
jgi:hypothetical protein